MVFERRVAVPQNGVLNPLQTHNIISIDENRKLPGLLLQHLVLVEDGPHLLIFIADLRHLNQLQL